MPVACKSQPFPGAIDASGWIGRWNDMALGLHETANYYCYPGFHEPGTAFALGVNKTLWDGLDPDGQNVIATAAAVRKTAIRWARPLGTRLSQRPKPALCVRRPVLTGRAGRRPSQATDREVRKPKARRCSWRATYHLRYNHVDNLSSEAPMADPIVFPGTVEWSGENPGVMLKETADGPFVALASFFRVVLSPHGRGHALVLLQSPQDANPPAQRGNFCLHDNEALARHLIANFVAHFGAFRDQAGLDGLVYRTLDSVEASGDPASSYSETVKAGDLTVRLTWSGLGEPFCFALPPDKSATGKHHMPSLFVGCQDASITVNGRELPGKPVPREMAGHTITTAMLAFSETWIRA